MEMNKKGKYLYLLGLVALCIFSMPYLIASYRVTSEDKAKDVEAVRYLSGKLVDYACKEDKSKGVTSSDIFLVESGGQSISYTVGFLACDEASKGLDEFLGNNLEVFYVKLFWYAKTLSVRLDSRKEVVSFKEVKDGYFGPRKFLLFFVLSSFLLWLFICYKEKILETRFFKRITALKNQSDL
ncbi:hypothetical protein ACVBEJ_13575 [Porticoccus sp. GXU_MW_L64]